MRSPLAALVRDRRGNAAIEQALLLPLMLALTLGVVEISGLALDYHRANEATRRGARLAAISPAIVSVSSAVVTCTGTGEASVASGGSAVVAPESYVALLAEMRRILPAMEPSQLRITYAPSGIGDPSLPGGVLPHVTVGLSGYAHSFVALHKLAPGLAGRLTLPDFATSYLSNGT